MRLANVCPPQQHWFKEELASNAVVFASMADNDSQLPGADNEVEEEEELEANEVEDEEEECEAEEEGPTAAASSPPCKRPLNGCIERRYRCAGRNPLHLPVWLLMPTVCLGTATPPADAACG